MHRKIVLVFSFIAAGLAGFSQPQKEVKAQIDSLMNYIRNKATEDFAKNTVYTGDDEKRKWKDVYNPDHEEELKTAKKVMEQLKKTIAECNYREFNTFQQGDKNKAGWYVYTYACGSSKKIHLAFLKIHGKYVLGDIDVEDDEDD